MKKSSKSKIIFKIIIALMLIFCTKSYGFYTEDVINNAECTEEYLKWENMSEEEKQNYVMPRKYDISSVSTKSRSSLKSALSYAKLLVPNRTKYDLRNNIEINVRDQGTTGICWAIATNSALETNISMTTKESSPLFSARYTEYATSKTFLDGINTKSYNREVGGGGFAEIALGLYTSGNGPVLEEDFPFENNENKIKLENIQNLEIQKQVKDYVRFPGIYKTYSGNTVTYKDASGNVLTNSEVTQIRNMIKEHIIKYGAVVAQTYGVGGLSGEARKYYNNQNQVLKSTAYFCNNADAIADHQITIIGWDDDYAVTNFNKDIRPSAPGAYIVLNSWGEGFGENGIFYISYEDSIIERSTLGIVCTENIDFDNIYQHDELGNNYEITALKDMYGANVFEREKTNQTEWLTQISLSSSVDTNCDVYVNANNGELKLENFKKVLSNVEIKNGYHTFELNEPLRLTGDKFAVMVKYKADKTNISYLPIEGPDDYYWKTATAKKGESYISTDGNNWDDMQDLATTSVIPEQSNLCIKAFTQYKEDKKYFEVNNYKMNEEYIYEISPKTKISELTNNIQTNMEYYVYKENEKITDYEQIMSTGMEIRTEQGTYKIVVRGDVNGDGKLTITDVVKVNLHVVQLSKLKNEFEKAADVTGNSKVTISDVVLINLASVNLKKI